MLLLRLMMMLLARIEIRTYPYRNVMTGRGQSMMTMRQREITGWMHRGTGSSTGRNGSRCGRNASCGNRTVTIGGDGTDGGGAGRVGAGGIVAGVRRMMVVE